jgi:hypothetical protein
MPPSGSGASEEVEVVNPPPLSPVVVEDIPPTPATEGGSLDPIAKKIRNLNKKVRFLVFLLYFYDHTYADTAITYRSRPLKN